MPDGDTLGEGVEEGRTLALGVPLEEDVLDAVVEADAVELKLLVDVQVSVWE